MGRALQVLAASAADCRFMVGRDPRGRWIVRGEQDVIGGIFTDQASAIHFALFESDYAPGAVWCAPIETPLVLGFEFDDKEAAVAQNEPMCLGPEGQRDAV